MDLWIPSQREKPFFTQIVVKAIIFDEEGRILLLRKPPSEWRKTTNGYDLPGGKLEESDRGDAKKALRREVEEETGLKITFLSDEPTSSEKESRENEGRILLIKKFPCIVKSSAGVRLSDEHDYYGWLTPEQLRSIKKSAGVSWLFIRPENIGCPPGKTVKDWIDDWKDVPDQMIEDMEKAWNVWMKHQQKEREELGRER